MLSAFTFGGGYVIVPLMKEKFVEKLKWIDEEEMLNLIAIAQSSPGAIAINTSIILGYKVGGIFGSFCTILGAILPPLIVISIISQFYEAFRSNPAVSAMLNGMQAGVAAVIANVVYDMTSGIVKKRDYVSIFIMLFAFVAQFYLKVNIIIIIVSCGLLGALRSKYQKSRVEAEQESSDTTMGDMDFDANSPVKSLGKDEDAKK